MAAQREAGGRQEETDYSGRTEAQTTQPLRASTHLNSFHAYVRASSGEVLVLSGLYLRIIGTYARPCMHGVRPNRWALEECVTVSESEGGHPALALARRVRRRRARP
jgi:hypothetical protein